VKSTVLCVFHVLETSVEQGLDLEVIAKKNKKHEDATRAVRLPVSQTR